MKKLLSIVIVALAVLGLVACGDKTTTTTGKDNSTNSTNSTNGSTNNSTNSSTNSTNNSTNSSTNSSSNSTNSTQNEFVESNYANGAFSYVASSYEERTQILGLLEAYAVRNNLTGLTIYEDGGYVMYDTAVVKGTQNYIPGYGFGIVSEGYISEDMATESNAKWKKYYHTYEVEDPSTINYMNDKGSVVGDLVSYTNGTYWTTAMNETGDGYEWIPALANDERPVALDAASNGLATKYRLEVKVGGDLKYDTFSTTFAKYKGREVALEDYITPYKMLYTQLYAMKRGSENLTGAGSIKGTSAYYNSTKNGEDAKAWENVGIKSYVEGGKSYLEFEFNIPCSEFYAMYYLSSSLATPVPAEFITELGKGDFAAGMKAYGNFTDGGLTPVDTYLSCGPYTVEAWEEDLAIVFGRNKFYTVEGLNRYLMEGIHVKMLPAAADDPLAAFNQFEKVKTIHAVSIPKDKLNEYKSDPRTTTTVGSSTTKLNMNTCTQEEWIKLFGQNGTVLQNDPADYWECEPAMSNDNFIAGLSFAIDRKTLAESIGRTPSANYFGTAYLSDPENGISYNNTDIHKEVMAKLLEGTDYGYNLEFAKASFKKACEELIASGAYKAGDKITIEVTYQSNANITNYGAAIAKYWTDAFNACGGGLTLEIENYVPADWMDAYEKKMQIGQFDIGLGGINGNTLNPLNFLEVLKSDNSSSFTLNWGVDTNQVSEEIYWDGMYWSFDALWLAADKGGVFENGVATTAYSAEITAENSQVTLNQDGSATVVISTKMLNVTDCEVKLADVIIFGTNDTATYSDYDEESVGEANIVVSADGSTVTVTISAELVAKYCNLALFGMDVYFDSTICGISGSDFISVYFEIAK